MIKRILFLNILIVAFISCEDREPDPIIVPEWLKPRLEELEDSGNCFDCKVQRWNYNDEFFYTVYCGFWSCAECEVYRYNGDLVTWVDDIDHADYAQKKDRPLIVWKCGDEL